MTTTPTPDSRTDALRDALKTLAQTPVLLVISDYDGTLAPIVDNPGKAEPVRESIVAFKALAALPHTHAAVVSGRALSDLARLSGFDSSVTLVGSHGSEFDQDFMHALTGEQRALRERIKDELCAVAGEDEKFRVEFKPASVAFHYREADEASSTRAIDRIMSGPGGWDGVQVKSGKQVLELAVVETSKGDALEAIRHHVGATGTLFVGDDVTDEDAFDRLRGPDIGIKVGPGATKAQHRIGDTQDVARTLASLLEERRRWIEGGIAVPIERHSMLSDARAVALVAPGARLCYMCAPRIDGPALFAELLGGPPAGHFTIEPYDVKNPDKPDDSDDPDGQSTQRYDEDSLVLITRWKNLTVTDFLDCSGGKPTQRAGRSDLIRSVRGKGSIRIIFAPRLDFGRVATRLNVRDDGLEIDDTIDPIVLRAPGVRWEIQEEGKHHTAVGTVELSEDQPLELELRYGTGDLRPRTRTTAGACCTLTKAYWSSWVGQLTLPELENRLVARSALTLKGLCYGPSGAIAAAATTSLPEHIGGVRNWDYRYCWLRDGAMSATSLVKLGVYGEAIAFLDWVLGVVDKAVAPQQLRPLYSVTGHEAGAEAEIGELSGYAGSRPVRIGNAAKGQVQLDVFGPIVELMWQLVLSDAPISSQHWRLVEALVHAVEARWEEPDHGIWEIRKHRRHHVHSKVMCWLTVDRGIRISERFLDRPRPDWEKLRDMIGREVLEKGWNEKAGAFTAAYGGDDLDAAALWIGLSGLLDCTDPRFVSTIDAVEAHLRHGPIVYRYLADDGLPGLEGGFYICSSWLIEALARSGRRAEACDLFEQLTVLSGPTGLLPEQYDPRQRLSLGNHPQAYSHIGIIENAILLSQERIASIPQL